MWSEIFWWEVNIALNLTLNNNVIYKECSWQGIIEQLKYDAMESSLDWMDSFECKKTEHGKNPA